MWKSIVVVLAIGHRAVAQAPSAVVRDAYVYAYPLVTMEMTRRVMTNTARAESAHAPMGQLALMREYPTAQFRDVTAPNADTLYSVAWLDLSKEPYNVQHDSPGKTKEANWLPAPAGKFVLMLRMYWPKDPVLNGSWKPPPVQQRPPSSARRPTTPM